jgi:hypothetical protein
VPPSTEPAPSTSPIPWSASLRLIAPVAVFKILLLLLIYCSVSLIPNGFNIVNFNGNFHWPPDAQPTLATYFSTWDAQHYLYVSQHGYIPGSPECAFYPLWPALIRAVTISATANPLIPALVLGNLLSLAAVILLHRWAALECGLAVANVTLLLTLAYPSAFYLALPYSESLFLLLAVGLFLAMRTNRIGWIWTLAFFLPLARAVGFLCIFPIVTGPYLKRQTARAALLASAPCLGLACYFLIFYLFTGDALAGVHAQSQYGSHGSLLRLLAPGVFLANFFRTDIALTGFLNSGIDRAAFVLMIAALIPMSRRSEVDLAYTIPLGIVPAMTMYMWAFTRYALMLFPVFLIGAIILSPPRRRPWLWVILAFSFALQILLLIRHTRFNWVG